MKKIIAIVGMLLGVQSAFAVNVVLESSTSQAKIQMADYPGVKGKVLVAWDDMPGESRSGAMVYYTDKGASETRYFAVGGGGYLSITDGGAGTLVKGTLIPVYSIVYDDPQHPLMMRVSRIKRADTNQLLARYRKFEEIASSSEGQAQIQKSLNASATRTAHACGGHLKTSVDWSSFAGKRVADAKQGAAVLQGIAKVCSDPDYKEEISKFARLEIAFAKASGGDIKFEKTKSGLKAYLGETSFNPRETVAKWLKDNL